MDRQPHVREPNRLYPRQSPPEPPVRPNPSKSEERGDPVESLASLLIWAAIIVGLALLAFVVLPVVGAGPVP